MNRDTPDDVEHKANGVRLVGRDSVEASENDLTLVTRSESLASVLSSQENIIDIRDSTDDTQGGDGEPPKAAGSLEVEPFLSGDSTATSPADERPDKSPEAAASTNPAAGKKRRRPKAATPGKGATRAPGGLNKTSLTTRVITGVTAAVVAVVAFSAGPGATLALATVIVLAAAIELFDGLRRVGYRPATLLGLVGVVGVVLGAYARGIEALPLVTALMVVFTLAWFLIGVSKAKPTVNVAVTVLAFVWVGLLGSYSALLLRLPDGNGMAFLVAAVIVTIAYDTGAYLGGSLFGRRPMAPLISPNKTWEGLIAGTAAAFLVGALLVQAIGPWTFLTGAALGLVVAVVAPLGDLAESMVKRDLNIKDMGRLLPGHGGVLDRMDALLFVLPATYYLVLLLNIG